jgi:hypothetical protein
MFHPIVKQQVLLEDAFGIRIDLRPEDRGQVIFIEVEGTTAFIRTGVFNEEGLRGVAQVLESFRFSP